MLKRTLTVMALAVLLNLAAVPAMAKIDQGKTTREATATRARTLSAETVRVRTIRKLRKKTVMYVQATRYRQKVMGVPQTMPPRRVLASVDLQSLRSGFNSARKHSLRVLEKYRRPPMLADWMCIHHYEGAWDDSGSPYWGGLQMDLTFQRKYGGWLLRTKGTADHWTPMEQIWVAERAHRSRGFSPWPNTARDCGLY